MKNIEGKRSSNRLGRFARWWFWFFQWYLFCYVVDRALSSFILQIPATYFWAWSAVVLYENGRKYFKDWIFVPYIATLAFLLYSYQPFFFAIRGGIGACVAGRTMKVSQWVSQEYGKEQPILLRML